MKAISTSLLAIVASALLSAACAGDAASRAGRAPETPPALAAGHDLNRSTPLTVLPVSLAGKPMPQVAEVLGMMLERGGMSQLALGDTPFAAASDADAAATSAGLAAFLREHPPATDYVLYCEIRAADRSISEVRSFIATKGGDVVWQERQAKGDAAFDAAKIGEPMEACAFLAGRLRPVLQLDDPFRRDAPEGPLAARWNTRTGLPEAGELNAMKERQRSFRDSVSSATLEVHRPQSRAGVETSGESLRTSIAEARLMKTELAVDSPRFDIVADMNEQKVLWSLARQASEHVRAHAPKADYVLFADYLMGSDPKGNTVVGAVHLVVCDRKGDIVIADFQNSHHADFQAVKPTSVTECDTLAVRRLASYCK